MSIEVNDSDLWYKVYADLDSEGQEEYVIETLMETLPTEFLEETEFIDVLIELFESLIRKKEYDNMINIYENIVKKNPQIMDKSFFYIDKDFIDYYLFMGNKDKLIEHTKSYVNDPEGAIDYLLILIDKLCYYGYDDIALDICKKVYGAIVEAEGLIGGVDGEFSNKIFFCEMQQLYIKIKNNDLINKEEYLQLLEKYDININNEFDEIVNIFKSDITELKGITRIDFNENRREYIRKLMFKFCIYMLDNKNVKFNTSKDVFYEILNSSGENEKLNHEGHILDSTFMIDQKKYDSYLASKFHFLCNDQMIAVQLVYGAHYLYDYLYENDLISEEAYKKCVNIIEEKRKLVLRALSKEAWKFSFVYTWNKPSSINYKDYELEREFAHKTFKDDIDFNTYMPEEYLEVFKTISDREKEEEEENNTVKNENKVGRNEECPCGSGKKYKKCCGKNM